MKGAPMTAKEPRKPAPAPLTTPAGPCRFCGEELERVTILPADRRRRVGPTYYRAKNRTEDTTVTTVAGRRARLRPSECFNGVAAITQHDPRA